MTVSPPALLAALMLTAGLAAAAPAAAAECANAAAATVPGAERQEQACLDDMTTAGHADQRHTDASDWAGLTPTGSRTRPASPGLQIDGYFPDTSTDEQHARLEPRRAVRDPAARRLERQARHHRRARRAQAVRAATS